MKTMIAAIAVAVGGLAMAAGPAAAQNEFGSIAAGNTAYGESIAYGFAFNYDKDDAKVAALNACRAAGGTDCVEVSWVRNGCGALAIDQYGIFGANGGMTPEAAAARAVRECEDHGGSGCAVVASTCVTMENADTWSGSKPILAKAEVPAEAVRTPDESLTREQRVQVQQGLAALGFDTGPADGLFGPKTRAAIWDWQEAKGLEATGYLTAEQGEALGAISREAGDQNEPAGDQTRGESAPEPSGQQNVVLHFPRCSDLEELAPDDSGCWKEIANRQDCVFFFPRLFSDHRKDQVTWSGSCQHNTAHGKGKLEYNWETSFVSDSGELVEGKMQGLWVLRYQGHTGEDKVEGTQEGHYVDGVRHGYWVGSVRWHSGGFLTFKGPYVDGLMHGRWETRNPFHTYIFHCHHADGFSPEFSSGCERVDVISH